jgi:hypothetical protein
LVGGKNVEMEKWNGWGRVRRRIFWHVLEVQNNEIFSESEKSKLNMKIE